MSRRKILNKIFIRGGVMGAVIGAILSYLLPELLSNAPPIAKLVVEPKEGEAPLDVRFLGASSKDPEGKNLRYLWQINGDTVSYEREFSRLLRHAGLYDVLLTVFDHKGLTDSEPAKIFVAEKITLSDIATSYGGYFHFSKDSSRFTFLAIEQIKIPQSENNIRFRFYTSINSVLGGAADVSSAAGEGFYDQETKRIVLPTNEICKVFRNSYGKIIIQSIDRERFPFLDFSGEIK